MKPLIFLIVVVVGFRANAIQWAPVAEFRSVTADSSGFSPAYLFQNQTNSSFGGGVLASLSLPVLFFRTGVVFVPRLIQYQYSSNANVTFSYTQNCIDIPFWVGAKFGFFGVYGGGDVAFKTTSAITLTNFTFAGTPAYTENSTSFVPQVGVDFTFGRLRASVFYEVPTTLATEANNGSGNNLIRADVVGARLALVL